MINFFGYNDGMMGAELGNFRHACSPKTFIEESDFIYFFFWKADFIYLKGLI